MKSEGRVRVQGASPDGSDAPTATTPSSRGRGSRQRTASAAIPLAGTATVAPVNRGGTPQVTLTTPVKAAGTLSPLCRCGCGGTTKGGKFRPGHDSKFRSQLRNGGVVPPQVHYGKAKVRKSGIHLVRDNTKVA